MLVKLCGEKDIPLLFFFFSSRRRHTRFDCDWSSDVCSSDLSSRTRLKTLSKQTIDDNARFFEHREDVPVYAITMGVGTILDARKLVLVASGKSKARAIAQAVEG